MSRRKPGLSLERHQAIGLELARIADRLTVLGVEIGNAYPKTSKVYRLALLPGPDAALYRLRSELDDRMFAEHHVIPAAMVAAYWPPQETRRVSDDQR